MTSSTETTAWTWGSLWWEDNEYLKRSWCVSYKKYWDEW